jgi:hypothetical protein
MCSMMNQFLVHLSIYSKWNQLLVVEFLSSKWNHFRYFLVNHFLANHYDNFKKILFRYFLVNHFLAKRYLNFKKILFLYSMINCFIYCMTLVLHHLYHHLLNLEKFCLYFLSHLNPIFHYFNYLTFIHFS